MKILLTHSYYLRYDAKQWKLKKPYAPLGTLYAISLLLEHNYDVAFHDVMFSQSPHELKNAIIKNSAECVVVYDDGFNYLTKMCLTKMREAAFEMIRIAKEKDCIVIVSSSDATDHFEKYINAGADYIMVGEGEHTLLELIQNLSNNQKDFSNIDGLVFKKENEITKTKRRVVLKDLDTLPMPAWDLIDIKPYKKMWLKSAGYFSINIGTTRGCPFKCNWCAKPIYGNRYNVRSPKNVVKELNWLKQLFGYRHVWFCDDIFGLKPGWVEEFANLIVNENLVFQFKIQSRADLLTNENYVNALAIAGCNNVWMGAESGSQKILDAMEKGTTVEQIAVSTALLKKYGIKPSFFIQFGYLGETRDDIELTIKMINELKPDDIGISVSYPLPGTKFYDKVKEYLSSKENWVDSDDLDLMYTSKSKSDYYKQLHRYVHKNFRKQVAFSRASNWINKPFTLTASDVKKMLSYLYYLPSTYLEKRKLLKLSNE